MLKSHSVFLAKLLRHQPQILGLSVDNHGWVDVNELILKSQNNQIKFTKEILEKIVQEDDKKRYKFNEDHTKIRASQGHSFHVDLELEPKIPPEILYHGTATRFLKSIMNEGLRKMSREYVHLSSDIETARKVGARHGKIAVLRIDSKTMTEDGFIFFLSENNVWLTDSVPTKYIQVIEGDI